MQLMLCFAMLTSATAARTGGRPLCHRPARACCQLAAPPPPSLGASARSAVLRVAGSTGLGAASGSALHAALPLTGWVDGVSNIVTLLSTTSVGAAVGVLWATEAALVGSGVITAAFLSAGGVVAGEADREAGARALETIQATLRKLRETPGIQGFVLGAAFNLCGLTDSGAAIERLAAEAEAGSADGARPRALSELLGLAVEATLSARFFDLKVAFVAVAAALLGAVDGALLLLAQGVAGG